MTALREGERTGRRIGEPGGGERIGLPHDS